MIAIDLQGRRALATAGTGAEAPARYPLPGQAGGAMSNRAR